MIVCSRPIRCCCKHQFLRVEAHKELKKLSVNASGRDNLEHTWKTTNDSLAMKAMADGVYWEAICYARNEWVHETVKADAVCYQVLRDVLRVLSLAPASTNDENVRGVKPSGLVQWDAALMGAGGLEHSWQGLLAKTLPTASALEGRYAEMLACGRTRVHKLHVLFVLEEQGPRSCAHRRSSVQPFRGCCGGGKRRHDDDTRRGGEGCDSRFCLVDAFEVFAGWRRRDLCNAGCSTERKTRRGIHDTWKGGIILRASRQRLAARGCLATC